MEDLSWLDGIYDVVNLPDENNSCNWITCIEKRSGKYLCKRHLDIIKNELQTKSKRQKIASGKLAKLKPKPEVYQQNECAAKRCLKAPCLDSNVCIDHEVSLDHIKPTKEYECLAMNCKHIVVYQQKYCIAHL